MGSTTSTEQWALSKLVMLMILRVPNIQISDPTTREIINYQLFLKMYNNLKIKSMEKMI